MRVFVAGGSGLLGVRLVPRLVADGHEVAATTRTPAKASMLAELGATPVVFDAFEADELADAVMDFAPTAVIHSLTHLPDDRAQVAEFGPQHQRTLREGTTNLVAAAQRANVSTLIAQSIAWEIPGPGGAAYAELERLVLGADGVVLRFGYWYGPGTWIHDRTPPPPRVHIDAAAEQTVAALAYPSGVYTITDAET